MTHAHGAHGDEHTHPKTMTESPAGEPVQLGPNGKFSKWPLVNCVLWLVGGAVATVWLVVRTIALTAMPLEEGHATDAISDKAVIVLVVGATLVVLAIVAIAILLGGSGRNLRSWVMTLLFVGLWVAVAVVAGLCVAEAAPLSQAWKIPNS
jgi:hypothetical protein